MSSKHSNFWKQKDDGRASDYSGRAQDYSGRAQSWESRSRSWDHTWHSSQTWESGQLWNQQHDSSRTRSSFAAAQPRRKERYPDEQVLRCTWPGPRNKTFPPKGHEYDFRLATEYAASVNLATCLKYFFFWLFFFRRKTTHQLRNSRFASEHLWKLLCD